MELSLIICAIFSATALSYATWRIASALVKKETKDDLYLAHENCKVMFRNCGIFTLMMAISSWAYPQNMGIFGSLAFVSIYNGLKLNWMKPRLLMAMELKHEQNSVVMFHTLMENKELLRISVVETHKEWPPLALELGLGNHYLPAKKAPQNLIQMVNTAIGLQLAKSNSQDVKAQLQRAGANHPIDIEGSNASVAIREFFEKIMLEPQPA